MTLCTHGGKITRPVKDFSPYCIKRYTYVAVVSVSVSVVVYLAVNIENEIFIEKL